MIGPIIGRHVGTAVCPIWQVVEMDGTTPASKICK